MKKILSTIIILATLIPNITFGAFAVPWSATSTSQGWVSPNTVNGINFIVRAISFIASSTTSSSIFPYASTTALSAGTLCLTADTCRTTWPTGGSGVGWASTTADINSIYFTGGSTGNVGIGTTTPYAKLAITNTGTSPSFVVEDSTSPDTTPFIIDASGNVGIGTTTPSSKLTVSVSSSGGSSSGALGDNFVLESGADNYINILTPLTSNSGIIFSDTTRAMGGVIYAHNGDYMKFFANGSEKMRIDSSGNVGIGTTSPYGKLAVTNTGTDPSFLVEDSTSPDTTPFIIDASGNVGIGTTNPGKTLDVVGNIQASGSVFSDTVESKNSGNLEFGYVNPSDYQFCLTASCATTAMVIKTTSGNVGIGIAAPDRKLHVYGSSGLKVSGYGLRNSVASTNSGFIQVGQSNSLYGLIDFNAYDSNTIFEVSNTYALDTAEMRLGGGFMTFRTGSTFTEKMRITSAGNVGIGLTSPNYKLEVNGTASTTALLTTNLTLLGSTTLQNFTFVNATGSAATTTNLYTSGQTVLAGTTGNVGIGTTTPSVGLTIGSGISYLCPQVLLSTSTSMTVDFNAGCNQIVRMGTSDTTISFTNGQPGQKLELTVCNPTTTSGNITFSGNMSYPGGLAPSHTTTANECDIYNFGVNYATTTAKYLLTGMQSGFK